MPGRAGLWERGGGQVPLAPRPLATPLRPPLCPPSPSPPLAHLSSASPPPHRHTPWPRGPGLSAGISVAPWCPRGPPLSFPLLLAALPTPVSGLIKELCSLFMYGPRLIGVFVFPHYSQLDRAV